MPATEMSPTSMRQVVLTVGLAVSISSGMLAGSIRAQNAADSSVPATSAPVPVTPRLPDVDVVAPPPEPEAGPSFNLPVDTGGRDDWFSSSPFGSAPVEGYAAPSATTGMIVDTPLLSLPQSIGIVTESLLRDQQFFSVGEAFRNVSGVQTDHTTGNTTANAGEFNYLIRGFPSTYRRWNGYRSDLLQTSIDTGNVERIEFIKGPASTMYGAADAGGFLNVVTKKPQAADFSRWSVSAGSWGFARTDVDVNRRLADDVGFRINLGFQNKDSFRDFVNDDRSLVAPVVAVRLSERTQLILEGEYYSNNTMFDVGVVALDGSFNTLPPSRLLMDPTDFLFGDYWKAGATLRHDFSDDWSAQLGYAFASSQQRAQSHFPVDRTGSQVVQIPVYQNGDGQLPTLLGNVGGRFDVGRTAHHVCSGFDLQWIDANSATEFFFADPYLLEATNPTYSGAFPTPLLPTTRDTGIRGQTWSIQDRVELSDRLEVVGGTSYQNFDCDFVSAGPFLTAASKNNSNGWTPRGSVIVHPVPDFLSTWYSYTESLLVQSTVHIGVNGEAIPATAGRQHEVGLRLAPSARWRASLAVFQIDKSAAPLFLPFGAVVPVDARSQGIEFDWHGSLTDRWSLAANYAYLDARALSDPTGGGAAGRQMPLVPHNAANVWTRYNLLDEPADGPRDVRRTIGVGSGLRWVDSSRTLNYPGYFEFGGASTLPAYVTWDLALFSQIGRWFGNFYFENVTAARYYTSGLGAFANPGNPFTVRATVGATF